MTVTDRTLSPAATEAVVRAEMDNLLALFDEANPMSGQEFASRSFFSALDVMLPGWYVTRRPGGDETIWMDGTPAHPSRPEPVMHRTAATAHQFDRLAALLPDRSDEDDADPVRPGRTERLHTQDCCLAAVANPAMGPRPGCPGVRDVYCGPEGADLDPEGFCLIHGAFPCPDGTPLPDRADGDDLS